jgi:ATP-dependent Lhr-like helicase
LADDEPLSPEDRAEARAHLLLARYGVVARELADGEWSTLRHALLRMEYGGEVVRGYFVEGLSGEQYALEDAIEALAVPSRRGASHVLVAVADPANVWGNVFTLAGADGTRVSPPRGAGWLVLRDGAPVALAQTHGREITTLAGWQPSDLEGVIDALADRGVDVGRRARRRHAGVRSAARRRARLVDAARGSQEGGPRACLR